MSLPLTFQVRLKWIQLRFPVVHLLLSLVAAGLIGSLGQAYRPHSFPAAWWLVAVWLGISWVMALVTHLVGHVVAARLIGDEPYRCTLWVFGDTPDGYQLPRAPGPESVIALAGPLANIALGATVVALWWSDYGAWEAAGTAWLSLSVASFTLGLVNLLPGQPLDGGRILTALLLYLHSASSEIPRLILVLGRLMALFLLGLAIMLLQVETRAAILGLWLGWLGWSLGRALRWEHLRLMTATVGRTKPASSLIGVQARVQADQPISEIAETLLAFDRSPLALVLDGDAVVGVLAADQLGSALRRRSAEPACRVMVPIQRLPQVSGQEPVVCAFELLLDSGAPAILVTEGQRIIGALALGSLSKLLRLQQSAHSTAVTDSSG